MQKYCQWLISLFLLITAHSVAQSDCDTVAEFVSVQGSIRLNGAPLDNLLAVREQNRKQICAGDLVSAGPLSRAAIAVLDTDVVIRVDQNTELRLLATPRKTPSFLSLLQGAVNIFSPAPRALEVETAFVNAAVEGTEFQVRVENEAAVVTVFEGEVRAFNTSGRDLHLERGQSAVARVGTGPVLDTTVVPGDAVSWTLYYAPLFDPITSPEQLDAEDPAYHSLRAQQALAVGAWSEARVAIEAMLREDSSSEEAWALNLIMAVARSDDAAIDTAIARAAVATPTSAEALIALSFAQQARFDLDAATTSLREAVTRHPDNALARARLAELLLATGQLDQALAEAEAADALGETARSRTVLGFASLSQVKTEEAKQAFRRAIELGSEDPLPHLGLGLAKIREGNLSRGLRDIVHAAGLGDIALVRSYLGKAYYEKKLEPQAAETLAEAKLLDPRDPTPWFYDAIRKQSVNRPVEALHDLQNSITLNDNRAVYRSRLLLDEDLASRSASLGRVYRDLGFEQLGLLEGWKSVNAEPANHSGHRLLADAYTSLPNHQIARTNELFQAQLLQPENVVPVKPQLADANLFVLDSAGPSDLAFNEFNPLFNRNRIGLQASAVVGGNDTLGEDIVLFGSSNRWFYSLGQYHFETDGFRENNDLEQDILNAYLQFRPNYKTSLQLELRKTETEQGDLRLRFDPDNYRAQERSEGEVSSVRLGLRHAFDQRSRLLVALLYEDAETSLASPPLIRTKNELEGYRGELQYLFSGTGFDLIAGASHLDNDADSELALLFLTPEQVIPNSATIEHSSAYVYTQLHQLDSLTLTLGANYQSLDGRLVERDEFYPKFGLMWEPGPDTVIRASTFRTLQRPYVSKQNIQPSLEPTQVAGFNQFFFGLEGEETWRYGIGVDHRFSPQLNGGVEYSLREREVPELSTGPQLETVVVDQDETFARAYLYSTPLDRVSLGAEYQYEDIDNHGSTTENALTQVETHRLALSLNFFDPGGLSGGMRASYVDQSGVFSDANNGELSAGEDSFWVLDATLGYRFPRRLGTLTLEANNLLDESFHFQDTDPENPSLIPERWLVLKISVALDK